MVAPPPRHFDWISIAVHVLSDPPLWRARGVVGCCATIHNRCLSSGRHGELLAAAGRVPSTAIFPSFTNRKDTWTRFSRHLPTFLAGVLRHHTEEVSAFYPFILRQPRARSAVWRCSSKYCSMYGIIPTTE